MEFFGCLFSNMEDHPGAQSQQRCQAGMHANAVIDGIITYVEEPMLLGPLTKTEFYWTKFMNSAANGEELPVSFQTERNTM
jgi:hypothetical protein